MRSLPTFAIGFARSPTPSLLARLPASPAQALARRSQARHLMLCACTPASPRARCRNVTAHLLRHAGRHGYRAAWRMAALSLAVVATQVVLPNYSLKRTAANRHGVN